MVIYGCDCEGEECVCHFYHYDCACNECPDCADDCFCFEYAQSIEETMDPVSLAEIIEENPEMLGDRPPIDPFTDDEILECGIENPEICDTCQ